MLITDKIVLKDYTINGELIEIPVEFIAYVDKRGYIKNLRGETYSKGKSKIHYKDPAIPDIDWEKQYDKVFLGKLIGCVGEEIDLKNLVFLIGDDLYDIYGRKIDVKFLDLAETTALPEVKD